MSFGNISPFRTNWGPASATQGGFLTASGNQTIGGDKQPSGIWTFSGKVNTAASTTTQAGLNIADNGTAPTSPVSGDVWMNTSHIPQMRLNATTHQFAFSTFAQSWTAIQTFGAQINLKSFTVATLPSAATAGGFIYVSNESGGATPAFSDGTNWRRVADRAIVS